MTLKEFAGWVITFVVVLALTVARDIARERLEKRRGLR